MTQKQNFLMKNNFNQFISAISFEINQFNAGKIHERFNIVLLNYLHWFEAYPNNFSSFISKSEFERIIDELIFRDFDGTNRIAYNHLKSLDDSHYCLDLQSFFKLYLILKIRRYQLCSDNAELEKLEKKLDDFFEPMLWCKDKQDLLVIDRDLPEFKKEMNSNRMVLPFSLMVFNFTIIALIPNASLRITIQIFLFILATFLLSNGAKVTKSEKDSLELKVWDYILMMSQDKNSLKKSS